MYVFSYIILYFQIFQTIQAIIAEASPVKKIIAMFEKPLWHALWKVWPEVPVHGCSYHWQHTIWAKMEDMGLKPIYNKLGPTHNYLQKVLALVFIPQAHIPVVFTALQAQAGGEQLEKLLAYIDISWITDTTWPVSAWCTFNKPLRTRTEVEDWCPCGKSQNPSLPFYILIRELHNLSLKVTPGLQAVTQKKLLQSQKIARNDLQGGIFEDWDTYLAGNCTATQLLAKCSQHVPGQLW